MIPASTWSAGTLIKRAEIWAGRVSNDVPSSRCCTILNYNISHRMEIEFSIAEGVKPCSRQCFGSDFLCCSQGCQHRCIEACSVIQTLIVFRVNYVPSGLCRPPYLD